MLDVGLPQQVDHYPGPGSLVQFAAALSMIALWLVWVIID
jgi:hypothetical protein